MLGSFALEKSLPNCAVFFNDSVKVFQLILQLQLLDLFQLLLQLQLTGVDFSVTI